MKVSIDVEEKEHFIGTDVAYSSYIVFTESINPKGEINKDVKGHFLTLFGAFNYLLNLKIKKSHATTLEELKTILEQAKKELTTTYTAEIDKQKIDNI